MELLIEGKTYRTGKLDAFTQLKVARKLGMAVHLVDGIVQGDNREKDLSILTLLTLSQIPDQASDFIVMTCLSVATVKNGERLERLAAASPSGGIQLMFDDTPMTAMLKIAAATIDENLGDFFRIALADLRNKAQKEQAL